MVHTNKLKGKIVENGLYQKDVAKVWGVTPATVGRKLNNEIPMTVREAFVLADLLGIPDKDFKEYFFNDKIA